MKISVTAARDYLRHGVNASAPVTYVTVRRI